MLVLDYVILHVLLCISVVAHGIFLFVVGFKLNVWPLYILL